MDLKRLRRGEMIAAISGIALLLVMFLTWFSISAGEAAQLSPADAADLAERIRGTAAIDDETAGFNAWQAFGLIDIVLFAAALLAIVTAVLTATSSTVSLPVAIGSITTLVGGVAVLLILFRIISPPSGLGLSVGVFLGLLAGLGIAAGGWMSMQDERAPATGSRRRERPEPGDERL